MLASLLIIDSLDFSSNLLDGKQRNKIYVASLSNDLEKSTVLDKLRSKMGINDCVWINVPESINKTAMECRENYIDWVDSFIERNPKLGKLFKIKGIPYNTWWLSLFFEKNTVKSQAFYNLSAMLFFLSMINELKVSNIMFCLKIQPEWIPVFEKNIELHYKAVSIKKNIENKNVFFGLKYFRQIKKNLLLILQLDHFIFMWLKTKSYFLKKGVSKTLTKNHSVLAVTYFPYLDKSALEKGAYKNTHYKCLQKGLENYGDRLAWLGVTVPHQDFSFSDGLDATVRLKKMGYSFDLFEEWISIRDIIKALSCLFIMWLRIGEIRLQFKESSKFPWHGKNYETETLFQRDINDSSFGFVFFQSILYSLVFKKIANSSKWGKVFYFCEMHAWERALCSAFKNTKKIAIQHTIVPLLLLNYFQGKCLTKNTNDCPKPDFIGCVGETTKRLFHNNGWKKNQLFVLGGFRFDAFRSKNNNIIPWQNKNKEVIVALSILTPEAETLIEMIREALAGQKIVVTVKPHPSMWNVHKIITMVNNIPNFQIVNNSLDELCESARCMIVTESSSCFFALNAGCPVVVPRLTGYLDMNPMTGFTDIQEYADSVEELREKVLRTMESKANPLDQEKTDRFLANYLDMVEDPMEYHRRIEEAINR